MKHLHHQYPPPFADGTNSRLAHRLLLCLAPLLLAGCFYGNDDCNLECVQGECVEGDCVCELGYFGGLCEYSVEDYFPGNYHGELNFSHPDTSWKETIDPTKVAMERSGTSAFQIIASTDSILVTNASSRSYVARQVFRNGQLEGQVEVFSNDPAEFRLVLTGVWTSPARQYDAYFRLARPK